MAPLPTEDVRRELFDQLVDDIRREYADWMEIGAIAIIFRGCKREAARLRQARVVTYCERAEPNNGQLVTDDNLNVIRPAQKEPCWKGREDTRRDTRELIVHPDNWCEGCKRRQAIHDKYRDAVKQRGIAMTKLMRRIDKFAKTAELAREAGVVRSSESNQGIQQVRGLTPINESHSS